MCVPCLITSFTRVMSVDHPLMPLSVCQSPHGAPLWAVPTLECLSPVQICVNAHSCLPGRV